MPFTKRQLQQIANVRGQAFIAKGRGNRAQRITESWLRRRVYSWEDKTIADEYRLFKRLYDDLKIAAFSEANTVDSRWRRYVLNWLEPRLSALANTAAGNALTASRIAFNAGYYGKLWSMDASTVSDAPLRITNALPMNVDIADWYEAYVNEADAGILTMRRITNRAVSEGLTPNQTIIRIGRELGVGRNPRGVFYRTQLQTRSAIMRMFNLGGVEAFKAQLPPLREADSVPTQLLAGIEFVSSRDGRVCLKCQSLDGMTWPPEALLTPEVLTVPPEGTHLGCRCGLYAMLTANYLLPENTPPDMTYNEWLTANGYIGVMGDFLSETDLESTQI